VIIWMEIVYITFSEFLRNLSYTPTRFRAQGGPYALIGDFAYAGDTNGHRLTAGPVSL
jgi:hypothetical protein